MDTERLKGIVRHARRKPIWDGANGVPAPLGRDEVERLIPHRDPFLFVDGVTHVDLPGQRLAGPRTVSPTDPVFVGHFPGDPVYPGVLQLEMMGQYILCLLALCRLGTVTPPLDARPPAIRAIRIHDAVFVKEVRPGNALTVLANVIETDDYTATTTGQILHGNDVCSVGVMEVYFVE